MSGYTPEGLTPFIDGQTKLGLTEDLNEKSIARKGTIVVDNQKKAFWQNFKVFVNVVNRKVTLL